MSYQSFASQLPYAIAPVLIVSALLKSFSSSTGSTRIIWPCELILGSTVIAASSQSGVLRVGSILTMAVLFSVFCGLCVRSLITKDQKICLCFGNLSTKSPRAFSCARNGALAVASVAGIWTRAESITYVAVIMAAVVLGAILYEEIR